MTCNIHCLVQLETHHTVLLHKYFPATASTMRGREDEKTITEVITVQPPTLFAFMCMEKEGNLGFSTCSHYTI